MFEGLSSLLGYLGITGIKVTFAKIQNLITINVNQHTYNYNIDNPRNFEELKNPENQKQIEEEVETQLEKEKEKIKNLPTDERPDFVANLFASSISSFSSETLAPSKSPLPSIYGEGDTLMSLDVNPATGGFDNSGEGDMM